MARAHFFPTAFLPLPLVLPCCVPTISSLPQGPFHLFATFSLELSQSRILLVSSKRKNYKRKIKVHLLFSFLHSLLFNCSSFFHACSPIPSLPITVLPSHPSHTIPRSSLALPPATQMRFPFSCLKTRKARPYLCLWVVFQPPLCVSVFPQLAFFFSASSATTAISSRQILVFV